MVEGTNVECPFEIICVYHHVDYDYQNISVVDSSNVM